MITNYDALTLGKFAELEDARDKYDDDNRRNIAILSVLSGKSEDELLDLPFVVFREMMDQAAFLRRAPRRVDVSKSYALGGWELVPVLDIRKMTTAQYIDYQTMATDADKRRAELLSCLIVPKGCRYCDGYDVAEVQDAIRKYMPITSAWALLAFFLECSRRSTSNMLTSSAKMLRKKMTATTGLTKIEMMTAVMDIEMAMISLDGGVGSLTLTPFLR